MAGSSTALNALILTACFSLPGFCGGVWIAVVPVYIAEFAEDGIRGMLSSVMVVGLTIGILFAYVMGSLITWRWLSIICSLFPLLCLGSILWMGIPESPRYLLAKSEKEKAVGSLKWFRGAASLEKVEAELTKVCYTYFPASLIYF